MRILLALLLIACTASTASAKCSDRFFVASGRVVDLTGAPVIGAVVGISWVEGSHPTGPAMSTTGADGQYSIPISFHTDSGYSFFTGDKCKSKLKQISASAQSGVYRSDFMLVPVGEESHINVEPLRIETPIQYEPLWPDKAAG